MPTLSTSIADALTALRRGELVAMPTETVYGLAANACDETNVQQIYRLKGRPSHNPLIVHVANAAMAQRYVTWNALAQALSEAFWPGALTLILPKRAECPIAPSVSAGGDTLAMRCPAHPIAHALIDAFDGGLAAPSANRSGRLSPTRAAHVAEEFADSDLLILDGGACQIGLESTVVDCTGDTPRVLRPGSISEDTLVSVTPAKASIQPTVTMDPCLRRGDETALKSPGLLTSHYAPSLPVRLNAREKRAGEALLGFGEMPCDKNLSFSGDLPEAAANLFDYLRELDQPRYNCIAVAPIPESGIGAAINDRLRRAAADR